MKTYVVIRAIDEHNADLTVDGARLIDDQARLAETFANDPARGMSVDVSATTPGAYQLRVELPDHPVLAFNGELTETKGERSFKFVKPTPKCITVSRTRAIEGDATSPVLITVTLALTKKHAEFVLVAGWDYSGGADNTQYALTMRDDLYEGKTNHIAAPDKVSKNVAITKRIHDHTIVVLYDFKSGKRIRWIKGQTGWHEIDRVLQGTVATHTGRYSDAANAQKRHDDDAISITHVYDYIIDLGRQYPGTLVGFHIFSHAWDGGPILVNTTQASPYNYGDADEHLRDPGDKDGRHKDFTIDNMPDVAHFQAAFTSDATLKVWGCLAVTLYKTMARTAAKARKDKKPRDQKLDFQVDGDSYSMTQEEIEEYFRTQIIDDSYMRRLGDAVGLPVYGAPPGAGANLHSIGSKNYMYVDQSIYSTMLKWYEDALGLQRDEMGHLRYD